MPSDITGSEILEEDKATGSRTFRFVKGPVFSNIVLADEINRTPPKTQAALLQSMQEHTVTISGETHFLPDPFFVLATQNPIEMEGTYPLPEAQLDRFMFHVKIGYPDLQEEKKIVEATTSGTRVDLAKAVSSRELLEYQGLIHRVPVTETVIHYAVSLVRKTRPAETDAPDFIKNWLNWGAGPRASQYLILGAKAYAALDGRATPSIEDIKAMALPVLRHRIILNFNAEAEGIKAEDIIEKLLAL
jgi:MoxR-like ATPase